MTNPYARILFLLVLTGVVGQVFWQQYSHAGPVMSASVSSDGSYAITAHQDQKLVLWNLKKEGRTVVSRDANIYSAYFIRSRPIFLWQDLDNNVRAQSVEGEVQVSFDLKEPTYGHLMTQDLDDYYYSNIGYGIFRRSHDGAIQTLKATDGKAFLGYQKVLNLSMDNTEKLLVSAGSGEPKGFEPPYYRTLPEVLQKGADYQDLYSVALWDLEVGHPIAKLDGNSSKTHATISPSGQWVISADENGKSFEWNTSKLSERARIARYTSGVYIPGSPDDPDDYGSFDDSQLIEGPPGLNNFTIAVAFIHNSEYYLRFGNNSHYAALFRTGSPWPVKYFDLGESPQLVTFGSQYSRNTAIATAPEAGVLVMGHRSGGGISVYRFDAEALTLERVWVVE